MGKLSCYGVVDPTDPEAAARCDRGGEIVRRSQLAPQMAWRGDRLMPTGWLVCARHMDVPQPQDRTKRLTPDPVPVREPRPDLEAAAIGRTLTFPDGRAVTDPAGRWITE